MRKASFILEVEVRPFPEFADRMGGEEFRRCPFSRRFPRDGFGAVLAKLERRGMFRIRPGAARTIEAVRLVHGEETTCLFYHRHLTANGIGHGFQGTPPCRSSLVFTDACNIVFAHHDLHRREVSDGSDRTDIFRNASRWKSEANESCSSKMAF